jgi:hypothetical protein
MSKPTLATAIAARAAGNYYEFRRYGAVIHRFTLNGDSLTNFWFTDTAEKCAACGNINWEACGNPENRFCSGYCAMSQEPIPCAMCGNDCRDSDYEKWNLCSRRCMVEY